MQKPTLFDFFTKEQPFGPITSPNVKDPSLLQHVFCTENLIYYEMSGRPSLIIGRRGAGKTAFLQSIHLNPTYKVIIELPTHKAFREIVDSIQKMGRGTAVFAEEISDLWNMIFWHTILVRLTEFGGKSEDLNAIKQYVSSVGLKKIMSPYNVMRAIIKILKERGGDNPLSMISEFLDEIMFNGITFTEARTAAIEFLERNNMRAIILIDALEDFQLDNETMCHAVAGLLRCQGSFHFPGSPCELRCCIPSELYHNLIYLSSNPNKDFQHRVLIHWHASELIQLAAHRYSCFLQLYHPDLHTQFSHLDLHKRFGATTFWHSLLPISIKNRVGIVEDPLAYILRHTQLLPRHLLMYLNQISLKSQKRNDNPVQFESTAIMDGVYETENTICQEIFSAYKYIHPGARHASERCISHLPFYFSDGELHKVYNRRGKVVQGIFDYEEFKAMMIEIGAIGRVTNKTDRYIIGLFEYTVPHKVIASTYDELCLHPVFTEVFHAIKPEPGEETRVVYPYGSDIDGEEFRELR